MLCADVMPRSANSALEQRECTLDCIGMGISDHIDFLGVVDRLMLFGVKPRLFNGGRVRRVVVGKDDLCVFANILADIFGERSGLYVLGMEQAEFTVTLVNSNHNFLVIRAAGSVTSPTDIGFIHFNLSGELRLVCFDHCGANTVTEIPRRLVAHSDGSLNLAGRHPLFRFAKQCGSDEPLPKRQMRVVKNGSGCYAKLVVAGIAVILEAICNCRCGAIAARTLCSIFPAQLFQSFTALFVSSELLC